MNDHIITINSGSSSIKFAIFESKNTKLEFKIVINSLYENPVITVKSYNGEKILSKKLQKKGHNFAISELFKWIDENKDELNLNIKTVGHRIVHGGTKFLKPVIINKSIIKELKKLIPLAPLHQPHNIDAIEIFNEQYPKITQIACFDTSFHRTQPKILQSYPLPEKYWSQGIIRYGFHGLSYEYITKTLKKYDDSFLKKKVIIAHLGNGASMCAIQNGKSYATTMGFTPIDGLMMGTRTGNIDPGIIIHLQEEYRMPLKDVNKLLYKESGLKGVSGLTNNVEELVKSNADKAKFAIDMFCLIAAKNLASLIPCIGGLDNIVFTAGIGENSPVIREKICSKLTWLNLSLNKKRNLSNKLNINEDSSEIKIMVIPTNEEQIIAKHAISLL